MQKILVEGGVPLHGDVQVSGAKNAVLPILCATLLADEPVEISNVPHLHDVVTTAKLLAGQLVAEQGVHLINEERRLLVVGHTEQRGVGHVRGR